MKKILIILIFTSIYSCKKENDSQYLISELTSDCPKELEGFKKQNKDSDLKFTELKTGIDSLNIFFGSMTKNNKTDYWVSSNFRGENYLQGVSLNPKDSLNFLSGDITFEFNPFDPVSHYSVSFRVLHQPLTNTLKYLWIDNEITGKTASIIKVEKPIQQGKIFPDITIHYISGETISTKDFKDKIIVINWWSTGCAPCREEIPELNKIARKYESNNDVLFLAITDDKKDKVEDFLKKHEFNYKQGIENNDISKVFEGSYPKHIIIDKNGIVIFYLPGYIVQTSEFIEKTIEQLLNEK